MCNILKENLVKFVEQCQFNRMFVPVREDYKVLVRFCLLFLL